MTLGTERPQPVIGAIFGAVRIEVGDGQHDDKPAVPLVVGLPLAVGAGTVHPLYLAVVVLVNELTGAGIRQPLVCVRPVPALSAGVARAVASVGHEGAVLLPVADGVVRQSATLAAVAGTRE